jgi:hypothetical protein
MATGRVNTSNKLCAHNMTRLLGNLTVAHLFKQLPVLNGSSLPSSQKPATGPHPEANICCQHPQTWLLQDATSSRGSPSLHNASFSRTFCVPLSVRLILRRSRHPNCWTSSPSQSIRSCPFCITFGPNAAVGRSRLLILTQEAPGS